MILTCHHCKKEKPKTDFFRDKHRATGRKPRCKTCEKLYSCDKERKSDRLKAYRAANAEKYRLIVRASMLKNIEHHKQRRREYLQTEQGRLMYRRQTQARYARKKAAFIEHVDVSDLLREAQGRCAYCGVEVGSTYHVDHYIPIARGGKHERSNLRISCAKCNLSKGAKMPEEIAHALL